MSSFYTLFGVFIASLIVSPAIVMGVSYLLRKYAILDRPEKYKIEKGRPPAPYGIWVSIFIVLLLFIPLILLYWWFSPTLEKRLLIMLILWGILTCVSFIDDLDTIGKSKISVPPLFRLSMQIIIGAIIGMTSIKISYISWAFWGILDLTGYSWDLILGDIHMTFYILPILITIFWYLLVFNAVNFSDWVPGLAGGFSLISFIILGGLALKLLFIDTSSAAEENSHFLLIILAIIIPVTFFVTRLDISRRWLMGDSGTIMLGFLIATLAIIAGGKIATAMAVIGIYLIDLVYVITTRILKGKNPLKWDQSTHLHFRLLELGLSSSQIRTIIFSLTAIFWLSAIFLSTVGKIILLGFITMITIFLTEILSLVKKK